MGICMIFFLKQIFFNRTILKRSVTYDHVPLNLSLKLTSNLNFSIKKKVQNKPLELNIFLGQCIMKTKTIRGIY